MLGAYERGERAISVPRLQRLARFYNVPVDQLLPQDEGPGFGDERTAGGRLGEGKITIDLEKLEALNGAEADMLGRYLGMIQVQRQDFNGRMLTIRRDDLRAIAVHPRRSVRAGPRPGSTTWGCDASNRARLTAAAPASASTCTSRSAPGGATTAPSPPGPTGAT